MNHINQWEIVILQVDVKIGQPDLNWIHIKNKIYQIVGQWESGEIKKPDVIVLPEMWNTGYALAEAHKLGDVDGIETRNYFGAFAKRYSINVIAGSIASVEDGKVSNRAMVFNREGVEVISYRKMHLFTLMDEEKFLIAGDEPGLFELDGIPCGLMICYDIRFPELFRKYALNGAKVVFVPAQWPNPRLHHWRTLLTARAIENQMYVVACNRVGQSEETTFFGHSAIIDPWGERVVEGSDEECVIRGSVDLDLVANVRLRIPIFADRRPECY